jgi:hypothetical protein
VTTLALAIKKLAAAAPKVSSVIKTVTTSADVQRKLEVSEAQNNRDVGQVCLAICSALVAHALGREPNAPELAAFLDEAVGDPAFPARAHRLLGEAYKAASWRRRAFLASMLYGLSFRSLPDDERDRVDMAIERMMPGDVELLIRIDEGRKRVPRSPIPTMPVGPSNVFALISGRELRLSVTDHWIGDAAWEEALEDENSRADRVALTALEALGCVHIGESRSSSPSWNEHSLTITTVGELVIRAIEEVRPGLDAPDLSRHSRTDETRPAS